MDKIKEVMTAFNEACSASYEAGAISGIGSAGTIRRANEKQAAAMAEFEAKLRELLEREPLSEDQVAFLKYVHANSAYVGGDFEAGVRYAERAHGIGNDSKEM